MIKGTQKMQFKSYATVHYEQNLFLFLNSEDSVLLLLLLHNMNLIYEFWSELDIWI